MFNFFRKKKTVTEADSQKTDSGAAPKPRICIVLCKDSEPGDLSQARVDQAVHQVFGRGYSVKLGEHNMIRVNRGESMVGILTHMPAPVPGGEAEQSAHRNFLWPNGKEEAAKHRSMVIITNIGPGDLTPIQSAISLSRLALVALNLFDGIGVYWGDGQICNSRAVFEDFCRDMSEESLPLGLWIRFQPGRVSASDDAIALFTHGMQQFGLMEIETDRCQMNVKELLVVVSNQAHYLVQNGAVIEDGDTFGEDANQRILVRHLPSMVDPDRLVYKLQFNA